MGLFGFLKKKDSTHIHKESAKQQSIAHTTCNSHAPQESTKRSNVNLGEEMKSIVGSFLKENPDVIYLGCAVISGMGDNEFNWLFVSRDKKSLVSLNGLAYWNSSIVISKPKTVTFDYKLVLTNHIEINKLAKEHFHYQVSHWE